MAELEDRLTNLVVSLLNGPTMAEMAMVHTGRERFPMEAGETVRQFAKRVVRTFVVEGRVNVIFFRHLVRLAHPHEPRIERWRRSLHHETFVPTEARRLKPVKELLKKVMTTREIRSALKTLDDYAGLDEILKSLPNPESNCSEEDFVEIVVPMLERHGLVETLLGVVATRRSLRKDEVEAVRRAYRN